jgi:hypothetical protein
MDTHHGKECVAEKLTAGDPHLAQGTVRDTPSPSPRLSEVTPGLDPLRPLRDAAMRANVWLRAFAGDVSTELRELSAEGKKVSEAMREESRRIWREVADKARKRIDRLVH